MIRYTLDSVEDGMRVAKPVLDNDGNLLLGRGVILNKFYLKKLQERDITSVFIQDENTDDIIPNENISDMVRGSTIRHLKDVFNILEDVKAEMTDSTQSAVIDTVSSPRFQQTFGSNPAFEKITDSAKDIVDELINGEVTLGLNSIKTYDDYTFQHSIDVAIVSIMIGRKIGLPTKRLRELGMGCILHDMGKVFIPSDIINKAGKLTDEEYKIVKHHPVIGYELTKGVPSIGILPPHIALQHHEKQDGSGYPRRLRGKNNLLITNEPRSIHLYGSISAVADIYDALSSDRSYRKAYPPEKVLKIMQGLNGSHLNHEALKKLLQIAPVYPEGTLVRIVKGEHLYHIAVVVHLNEGDLSHPFIRVIYKPNRQPANPVEINLLGRDDIKVESLIL